LSNPDRAALAVMFTDVVGFTSLMEMSEERALEVLRSVREVQSRLLEEHGGRLVKELGDGSLCTFPSASAAVRCARSIQEKLSGRDFILRIGIHWGEVILDEHDVLGDPVNVASRIQGLAPPGGVCVSGELLQSYGPGRRPGTRPLGLRKLKGLGRLVELFAVLGTGRRPLPVISPRLKEGTESFVRSHELPSVAVMPLSNLGPSNDDFYAYSISADLVSDLSRAGRILVSPLSDVLRLKRVVGSAELVAERLRVGFLVKGTLWRKGQEFQLSIELLELPAGKLIWTDNWMEDWYELPAIKGKMADGLLKVLGLERGAITGITDSETARSGAYEDYLRASELYWRKRDSADTGRALQLLERALESDPRMLPARILLGTIYSETGFHGRAADTLSAACDMALEKGDRAAHLNALNWIGINLWRQSRYREARNTFLRTLRLARSMNDMAGEARSLSNIGLMDSNMCNYERALDYLEQALSISGTEDVSSLRANTLCNIGLTRWHMGDNSLALEFYGKAMELYEVLEDRNGMAYMMRNLGIIKRNLGLYGEALDLTWKAAGIYEELGDRLGRCHSLNSMGNISMFLGKYGEASEYYGEAFVMAKELDDKWTLGIVRTNLGNLAAARGEYREALDLHQEALEYCRLLGDIEGEAENLELIGADHQKLGHLNDARSALEESISLMEEIGAGSRTVLPRTRLAGVLLDSGNSEDSTAAALEQASLAEGLLTADTSERTVILCMLSKVYAELAGRSPEEAEGSGLAGRSESFLREAHRCLMETVATISGAESRRTFLEGIESHREIIAAYMVLGTEETHP